MSGPLQNKMQVLKLNRVSYSDAQLVFCSDVFAIAISNEKKKNHLEDCSRNIIGHDFEIKCHIVVKLGCELRRNPRTRGVQVDRALSS